MCADFVHMYSTKRRFASSPPLQKMAAKADLPISANLTSPEFERWSTSASKKKKKSALIGARKCLMNHISAHEAFVRRNVCSSAHKICVLLCADQFGHVVRTISLG